MVKWLILAAEEEWLISLWMSEPTFTIKNSLRELKKIKVYVHLLPEVLT